MTVVTTSSGEPNITHKMMMSTTAKGKPMSTTNYDDDGNDGDEDVGDVAGDADEHRSNHDHVVTFGTNPS